MQLLKFNPGFHKHIYVAGIFLMLAGLPLSRFLMSLSLFVLVGNWLWEGNIKEKITGFFNNRTAVAFTSIYFLHLAGVFYSSDLTYALKDLRIKLPILILPLILSSMPALDKKWFGRFMAVFVGSVTLGTLISTYAYLTRDITDMRDVSVFISHIRFSLMICLSVFILLWFLFKKKDLKMKSISLILIIWLIGFLFFLKSATGVGILLVTALLSLFYLSQKQKHVFLKVSFPLLAMLILLAGVLYINNSIKDFYTVKDSWEMKHNTELGSEYSHYVERSNLENGFYVWRHISWKELENKWNEKSDIDFNGLDNSGQPIRVTLIRYLTSKGLKKDASAVGQLNDRDIKAVEKGVANYRFLNESFDTRVYKLIWQLDNYWQGGNPEGNSLAQRLEFWKAAIGIVEKNPVIGVGTGDVPSAFKRQYEEMNSPLSEKYRLRAHNQFLSITVAFGIIGFVWFMIAILYPLFKKTQPLNYFFITFLMIGLLSFLNEDTLETQAGLSFFTFFYCFFLWVKYTPNGNEQL